ncbi:hypothetical protein EMIT091MI3_130084 [Kosakonia quasisacchari]
MPYAECFCITYNNHLASLRNGEKSCYDYNFQRFCALYRIFISVTPVT